MQSLKSIAASIGLPLEWHNGEIVVDATFPSLAEAMQVGREISERLASAAIIILRYWHGAMTCEFRYTKPKEQPHQSDYFSGILCRFNLN